MIRSRYELKYCLTEAQALAIAEYIRPFMRPDHHCSSGWYSLVSLYLDSDDLRLYREAALGVKNRFKLRVRSYSDAPDSSCFFEIKRRINRVGVKSRARVPRWAVAPLLLNAINPSAVGCPDQENLEQFLYYRRQINARPVIELRYLREAFESRHDDDVRVTFDRRLNFKTMLAPELDHNGRGWHRPPERGVVLEIKFTRGYPPWISRLVHEFGLKQGANSKYKRAIKHEMRCGNLSRFMRRVPWNSPGVASTVSPSEEARHEIAAHEFSPVPPCAASSACFSRAVATLFR